MNNDKMSSNIAKQNIRHIMSHKDKINNGIDDASDCNIINEPDDGDNEKNACLAICFR